MLKRNSERKGNRLELLQRQVHESASLTRLLGKGTEGLISEYDTKEKRNFLTVSAFQECRAQ